MFTYPVVTLIIVFILGLLIPGIVLTSIGNRRNNKSYIIAGWAMIGIIIFVGSAGLALLFYLDVVMSGPDYGNYTTFVILSPFYIFAGFLAFLPLGINYLTKGILKNKKGERSPRDIALGTALLSSVVVITTVAVLLIGIFSTTTHLTKPWLF